MKFALAQARIMEMGRLAVKGPGPAQDIVRLEARASRALLGRSVERGLPRPRRPSRRGGLGDMRVVRGAGHGRPSLRGAAASPRALGESIAIGLAGLRRSGRSVRAGWPSSAAAGSRADRSAARRETASSAAAQIALGPAHGGELQPGLGPVRIGGGGALEQGARAGGIAAARPRGRLPPRAAAALLAIVLSTPTL